VILPIINPSTIENFLRIGINEFVNRIAVISTREMNVIELLIESSGELFEWIDPKYLSDLESGQAIANAYYKSSWFALNPDQAI
jgi:hypothetical protein